MDLIACVDKNYALGYNGKLLLRIPDDLKRFKKLTENKTVVMGRKTLESLPGSKPLPNRRNIVLTRNGDFYKDGVLTYCSLKDFINDFPPGKSDGVFIIGGAEVYRQFLPYCKRAFLTECAYEAPSADAFLENLALSPDWALAESSPEMNYKQITYRYNTYDNLHPAGL